MTKGKETSEKPNLKTYQKMVKKRYAWDVTNMLKQVQCGSCYRWYHYKCEGN